MPSGGGGGWRNPHPNRRRTARRPVSGRPVPVRVRGLPHFDQVAVGVADVAALLVRVLLRRRQELRAPGVPFGVHGVDVLDPDIEEAADPVGVARRLQDDRRLVVGRPSAAVDDDPAVGQRDIDRISGKGHPAAEYLGVEAPRALDVVRDDEVGQHDLHALLLPRLDTIITPRGPPSHQGSPWSLVKTRLAMVGSVVAGHATVQVAHAPVLRAALTVLPRFARPRRSSGRRGSRRPRRGPG